MESSLLWTGAVAAAAVLGVHGAYYGALADACLKIGTGLEGATDGTTGFQDAITPPSSTNARLINWLATLLLLGVSWYLLSGSGFAAVLAVRFVATIISGALMKADPPKKHFCRAIYRSISNREADYAKDGDHMRAEAIGDLRKLFERSQYAYQLTN